MALSEIYGRALSGRAHLAGGGSGSPEEWEAP